MKKKEVDLKAMFDAGVNSLSEADHLEIEAGVLALKFISILDEAIEDRGISRKELAEQIGTSPSFVTQVFRGNRKPNWEFLAKAQSALKLRFEISTDEKLEEWINDEIHSYHKRWIKSTGTAPKEEFLPPKAILAIEDEPDYALAG